MLLNDEDRQLALLRFPARWLRRVAEVAHLAVLLQKLIRHSLRGFPLARDNLRPRFSRFRRRAFRRYASATFRCRCAPTLETAPQGVHDIDDLARLLFFALLGHD